MSAPLRKGGVALGVLLLASTACSNRMSIHPDQLPYVTAAAARDASAPASVISASGDQVRLEGRLDAVKISMVGWNGLSDHFEAPIVSSIQGPWLIVQDRDKGRVYALSQVTDVSVQRYDTKGAVAAGTALTVVAGILCGGGLILILATAPLDHGLSAIGPLFGLPSVALGAGFASGGIPLLLAGKRKVDVLPAPPRPRPAAFELTGGPGGIAIRF